MKQIINVRQNEYIVVGDLEDLLIDRLEQLSSVIACSGSLGGIGHNRGRYFENFAFEMRDYYYGDCTCGYEELKENWDNTHSHKDYCYQEDRKRVSLYAGTEMEKLCKKHDIPYEGGKGGAIHCTCDYQKQFSLFSSLYHHSLDCPVVLPNFKSDDVEIKWYKNIGRGMVINRDVSEEEINRIFDFCEESIKWKNKTVVQELELPSV